MLYALLNWLHEISVSPSFFRLFGYITFRSILAAVTAFFICLIVGPPFIRYLKRLHIEDIAWGYGIVQTQGKTGTPTMGGFLIFFAIGISSLFWCDLTNRYVQILFFAVIWFCILGFVDDFLKYRHKSKTGLKAKYKLIAQCMFGILLGIIYLNPVLSPVEYEFARLLYSPFLKTPVADLGLGYAIFIALTVTAISNSVNLTDGLDGLAVVPSFFVAAVYGIFAYVVGNYILADYFLFEYLPGSGEIAIFCSAIFGAGMGFLWFNSYPAQIFMGDLGSLGLGGILATIAVLIKQEFLFLIAGGIFVVEAASSLLQRYIYIPIKGRRLLFRAPLHHTFQHRGLAETKVVVRFWIVSAILALISLSALKIR
ncbi:phospho-N-acetylmuramoyl-pentapeptide-transferase [bacterium]|nr:phospho-N-acetylmuramoyl-pentapeptide-transferase [candidate division CSSED10-310 bacterium]